MKSVILNALVLALDLAILAVYSLLQSASLLSLFGGSLEVLLLLEAGIMLLVGGAYVLTSGIFFGKIREQVFHRDGWSPEEQRRSEGRALPLVLAGVFILAESLLLALL